MIQAGQVYKSNDPRDGQDTMVQRPGQPVEYGRRCVQVVHVWEHGVSLVKNVRTRRHTTIMNTRLAARGSRGYTLVSV
jgi:hypothetical protein